jgi:hypothetical protein
MSKTMAAQAKVPKTEMGVMFMDPPEWISKHMIAKGNSHDSGGTAQRGVPAPPAQMPGAIPPGNPVVRALARSRRSFL